MELNIPASYSLCGTETMKTISLSIIPLLVILGSLFAHGAQRVQLTKTPDSVIKELYRVHNNGRGGVFAAKGKTYIYKFELGSLDFDPLYNAQDTKITNFQIGRPVVEGDESTVLVNFRNFGQRTRIKFEMHNGKEGWKIKNVIYGDKSDLVKVLKTRSNNSRLLTSLSPGPTLAGAIPSVRRCDALKRKATPKSTFILKTKCKKHTLTASRNTALFIYFNRAFVNHAN
jgi:hypothetical protein